MTKMNAEKFAVFCLFVVLGMASAVLSQADKQCPGFNTLTNRVTQLAKKYNSESKCQAFSNCSGIKCHGKGFGNTFSFSLVIAHCIKPIRFWMHLVIPNYHINETRTLQNGQKIDIFKDEPITYKFGGIPLTVKASLSVTPRIAKKDNNITLGASVCAKFDLPLMPRSQCSNLPGIQIATSPNSCPGTGTTKVAPTRGTHHMGIKTQPNTTKKALVKTTKEKRVTKMKLITSHTTKGKDEKTTQKKMSDSVHTKPHSAGKRKRGSAMHPTRKSPHSGSHGKGHLKSHSKDKSHGLSTGATVGLVSSMILLLLLAVGLIAYWRRLKRRRPAYYNDITVNRYDDEPLVDGHLVL